MSNATNDSIVEAAIADFEQFIGESDLPQARAVIENLREQGFDREADALALTLKHGNHN